MSASLPKASLGDTLAFAADVIAPNLVKGVIIRRPKMVALIDRLRSDANWAFLKPKRSGLREQFFARLNGHLLRASPAR